MGLYLDHYGRIWEVTRKGYDIFGRLETQNGLRDFGPWTRLSPNFMNDMGFVGVHHF